MVCSQDSCPNFGAEHLKNGDDKGGSIIQSQRELTRTGCRNRVPAVEARKVRCQRQMFVGGWIGFLIG